MPLLNTFEPFSDESGMGDYRRLSSTNDVWSWRELTKFAQVTAYRTSLFGRAEFLATHLGLDTTWSEHASKQEAKARGWKAMHRRTTDAFCPQCLQDNAYIRDSWEHVFVTACPKHGCQLVERCPACDDWLSPERQHIHSCVCGYELWHDNTKTASPVQRWISAQFSATQFKTRALKLPMTDVEPSALAQLIKLLCSHAEVNAPGPRRNSALPQTVAEAVEYMKPLEPMLEHWPHGFENHVRARIHAGNPDARTLNSLLGGWLKGLKRASEHPSLKPFLNITLRVAQDNFDGRITGCDIAQSNESPLAFFPAAQAAKWLGVSRDYLMNAINAGHCEYRTRRFGTRGHAYELPRAEVERLERSRQEWISDHEACNLLGVAPNILKNMLAAQVLVHDTQWQSDIHKAGPIERASIVALAETVHCYAQPQKHKTPTIQWSELTSRRMGDKFAIQSAMKAAASGEVRAVETGKKMGDARFVLEDVKRFFGTPVLEAGMSIQQLSENTGWKWETIAHWIQLGLLQCEQISLRGQPCKVVSPQQLLEFRRVYIPLSDLAHAMKTRSSSLSDKLAGIDIVGAKVEPTGAKRGGLVRVEDLGRWAVSGLAASRGALFGQQSLL